MHVMTSAVPGTLTLPGGRPVSRCAGQASRQARARSAGPPRPTSATRGIWPARSTTVFVRFVGSGDGPEEPLERRLRRLRPGRGVEPWRTPSALRKTRPATRRSADASTAAPAAELEGSDRTAPAAASSRLSPGAGAGRACRHEGRGQAANDEGLGNRLRQRRRGRDRPLDEGAAQLHQHRPASAGRWSASTSTCSIISTPTG